MLGPSELDPYSLLIERLALSLTERMSHWVKLMVSPVSAYDRGQKDIGPLVGPFWVHSPLPENKYLSSSPVTCLHSPLIEAASSWTSSCRNEFLAFLYEPLCTGKSQVWLWSSWSWAGGTTSPALCPRIRSQGKMITRDIRGLSLIKEKDEAYIIMVFQWINVYDKKEGARCRFFPFRTE